MLGLSLVIYGLGLIPVYIDNILCITGLMASEEYFGSFWFLDILN